MRKRGEPMRWRAANGDASALGPMDDVPPGDRWAFAPEGFEPMLVPRPGDWLDAHPEAPQSVAAFLLEDPNRPIAPRDTLVLASLGELDGSRPSLSELQDYLARFFALPVVITDPIAIDPAATGARTHDGRRQLQAGPILDLLETRLPPSAFCLLGVTREDLYPGAGWNFVFGAARLHARVGVQSLLRYGGDFDGGPPAPPQLVMRRGLAILSHEVGHMFGISHCVHHRCVMNGVNHLQELDALPLHLCRVCLRKLHRSYAPDLAARYERLLEAYEQGGFADEAAWVRARLATRGT